MATIDTDLLSDVVAFLALRFREHRECEDCWYSCPKSGDYCRDDGDTKCDCGKDQADALLARMTHPHGIDV